GTLGRADVRYAGRRAVSDRLAVSAAPPPDGLAVRQRAALAPVSSVRRRAGVSVRAAARRLPAAGWPVRLVAPAPDAVDDGDRAGGGVPAEVRADGAGLEPEHRSDLRAH